MIAIAPFWRYYILAVRQWVILWTYGTYTAKAWVASQVYQVLKFAQYYG